MCSPNLLSIAVAFFLLLGCGREELPYTDNSQDTELYAQKIRAMVERQCEAARHGDPSIHLAHLVQELERDDRPLGEREEIFDELRKLCREAVDLIQANTGQRPDLTAQLDGMIEVAGQLPETAGKSVEDDPVFKRDQVSTSHL